MGEMGSLGDLLCNQTSPLRHMQIHSLKFHAPASEQPKPTPMQRFGALSEVLVPPTGVQLFFLISASRPRGLAGKLMANRTDSDVTSRKATGGFSTRSQMGWYPRRRRRGSGFTGFTGFTGLHPPLPSLG